MAFLKWFLFVKNGPPFLSFGGCHFFLVFGSLLERGTKNKNKNVGLVAEPARPAEAGAGCLSGPAGLGSKIDGITFLRITCNL